VQRHFFFGDRAIRNSFLLLLFVLQSHPGSAATVASLTAIATAPICLHASAADGLTATIPAKVSSTPADSALSDGNVVGSMTPVENAFTIDKNIGTFTPGIEEESPPGNIGSMTESAASAASSAQPIDKIASGTGNAKIQRRGVPKENSLPMDPRLIIGAEIKSEDAGNDERKKPVEIEGTLVIEDQQISKRNAFRRWVIKTKDGSRTPLVSNMTLLAAGNGKKYLDDNVKAVGKWVLSPSDPRLKFLAVERLSVIETPFDGVLATAPAQASSPAPISIASASISMSASGSNILETSSQSVFFSASESIMLETASQPLNTSVSSTKAQDIIPKESNLIPQR